MKSSIKYSILCSVLLGVSLGAELCSGQGSATTTAPSREDTILVSLTASVEAIDYTNREVTLKGPLGNEVTFTVDKRVKRLDEAKVGDQVRADYYVSIAA